MRLPARNSPGIFPGRRTPQRVVVWRKSLSKLIARAPKPRARWPCSCWRTGWLNRHRGAREPTPRLDARSEQPSQAASPAMLFIPPKANSAFVVAMEHVLAVSVRPRDHDRPLVCPDETFKQATHRRGAPCDTTVVANSTSTAPVPSHSPLTSTRHHVCINQQRRGSPIRCCDVILTFALVGNNVRQAATVPS
jgi:hypothetical protein